jgi:hypothetical protein
MKVTLSASETIRIINSIQPAAAAAAAHAATAGYLQRLAAIERPNGAGCGSNSTCFKPQ